MWCFCSASPVQYFHFIWQSNDDFVKREIVKVIKPRQGLQGFNLQARPIGRLAVIGF